MAEHDRSIEQDEEAEVEGHMWNLGMGGSGGTIPTTGPVRSPGDPTPQGGPATDGISNPKPSPPPPPPVQF